MKILVLDDDDVRHEAFKFAYWKYDLHQARTHDEAVALLEKHSPYDRVFLDHDLNDHQYISRERTGLDTAAFITNLPRDKHPKEVIVHSWNPDGAKYMVQRLHDGDIRTIRWLFSSNVGDVFP